MRLAQSPRGERKFVTVCTDHVEKKINEHSGFLKLTWWKRQGHKDATLRSGTSWVAGACSAVFLYQEVHVNPLTVFIFQLEQFTPLFCNSFPLVKLVSALFTCTPTVSQTPNHKHLETLSCLNCLDWSELSGTTKLRALKLEFVITRVKISVEQSRGLKRASRSLSLAGKHRKCVSVTSLFFFNVSLNIAGFVLQVRLLKQQLRSSRERKCETNMHACLVIALLTRALTVGIRDLGNDWGR